jgi:signal transduction histidine kinase/CheY-like chemotaxis protein/HPt (histidine-containing phosphotransfer) domain-containing protein
MGWSRILKHSVPYLALVLFGLLMMVLIGYFSVAGILRKRLMENSQESLHATEENIKVVFSQSRMTLNNAFHILQKQIDGGASQQAISGYLRDVNRWMSLPDEGYPWFYGIHGYIRGEYFDSLGNPPDGAYDPQLTPWFRTAKNSGHDVAYTRSYWNRDTGKILLSVTKNLYSSNGEYFGIIVLDMGIDWLNSYLHSLGSLQGSVGIVLNQDMRILAHSEKKHIALDIRAVDRSFVQVVSALLRGDDLNTIRLTNAENLPVIVVIRRIFNDWYLVQITPESKYFLDMRKIALDLSFLALVLALVLGSIMIRINVRSVKADEANKSKSDFLANMSHEIRTPLNAIIGMTELALQEEAGPALPEYLANIRQAGSNLLSIINDILDLSKIESGGIRLITVSYRISSLVNNVVNVIRVRFHEKPILFLVNVDASIPDTLIGDEVRIRQILLNILSNAVKYTEEGFIRFTVTGTVMDSNNITLKFEVADSGIGIKEGDLKGLFGNFIRLDSERNRGIEGTGLGLAITKRLCYEMGGDITVSSVYGEGSVFTAIVPQEYTENTKMAAVANPSEKAVLLYDERPLYADSVSATLKNLKVPVIRLNKPEDFLDALGTGRFPYAFVSPGLVKETAAFIGDKKIQTSLALLANLEETSSFQGIPAILMPAYAVPVANLLNGVKIIQGGRKSLVRFTAPGARVLIVDDIMTNLKVAQGLLSAYRMQVDICDNGRSSISKVKATHYDLIFMDHMMPGMDGIEALTHIRALEGEYFKQVPIIALTANALSGMQEMFISKGFNDYLAKPIEISKLNALIDKWIPKEKQQTAGSVEALPEPPRPALFEIEGLDVQKGLAMTGGTEAVYREILERYCLDAEEYLPFLQSLPSPEDMRSFVIYVHALKSISATIGADALSAEALLLEDAGRENNLEIITEHLPDFRERLSALVDRINAVLRREEKPAEESEKSAWTLDKELLLQLKTALDRWDIHSVNQLLKELSEEAPPYETQIFSKISMCVLVSDFEEAGALLDSLLEAGNP